MSTIAAALRLEITRLARKEARAFAKPLHKAVRAYRRTIAELKRENARARADITKLILKMPVGVIPRVTEDEPRKTRYSAKSVVAQRKRLGLSAAEFGKLIGVTAHTIYSWEQERSRPRAAQIAAFAAIRGLRRTEAEVRLGQLSAKVKKGRKEKVNPAPRSGRRVP